MHLSYLTPAENAWERARRLLFRPIDIEIWAVLGFTAFLAYLVGHSTGISVGLNGWPRFQPGWPWSGLGTASLILAVPIGIAVLWLSSRCQPVFLDNVMHDRARLVEPWGRLAGVGNSLFLWRLGYALALLVVYGLIALPALGLDRVLDDTSWAGPTSALFHFALISLLLIVGIAAAYVALFLESFVVPLMWHRGCSATEGWRRFLPLLREHLPHFVAYGLVVFCGFVALVLVLMAASVATCCILPLLLSVPYLSSVLLLPVSVFFRRYSVEFLAQFSPEFDLRPAEVAAAPPAPPPGSPPPESEPLELEPSEPESPESESPESESPGSESPDDRD